MGGREVAGTGWSWDPLRSPGRRRSFLCMGVSASLGLTPPALSASHGWMGLYSAAEAPQAGPVQGEPRARLQGAVEEPSSALSHQPGPTLRASCRSLLLRVLHWHLDLRGDGTVGTPTSVPSAWSFATSTGPQAMGRNCSEHSCLPKAASGFQLPPKSIVTVAVP